MDSEPRGIPAAVRWNRRRVLDGIGPATFLIAGVMAIAWAAALGAGTPALAPPAIVVACVTAVLCLRQRRELLRLRDSRRGLAASDRDARERYENVAAAVMSIAADGRARSANRALVNLLGYANEGDLLAHDLRDLTYAGPGTLDALLRRARVDGELSAIEMTLRRRDGLPVMLAANLRTQWDEAGNVTGFEATMLDIGELKVADRQRRSVERRFRHLFDSNAVGFMFGNLRRASLDEANQYLRELLGVRASQLPIHLDSIASSAEQPLTEAISAALESGGHTAPTERTYLRADGRRVGVLMCVSTVDPLQGDFIAVVIERDAGSTRPGAVDGVTAFHDSILDALPNMVARFSTAGGLTYCNRCFLDWFGFPTAPLGWSLEDLLGPESHAGFKRAVGQALGGATEQVSLDLRRADGRFRRFAGTVAAHVRPDGKIGGFILALNEEGADKIGALDPGVPIGGESTYNE